MPNFSRFLAGFLCLAVSLRAQDPDPSPPPQDRAAVSLLRQLDEGFAAVFEQVAPSVVVIRAERENEAQFNPLDYLMRGPNAEPYALPDGSRLSEGSGFIIRPDGFILTNNHVIENAARLEVRTKDGRRYEAKVIGTDDKTDIAVLKIEAEGLPAGTLGDSDAVRVGQLVFAIGVPYNLDFSFSGGWISAKGRTNLLGSVDPKIMYEDYLQTDTFINPGNSGGPLFDVDGQVIGMNSYINGIGRGLAFAIPSNMLKQVSDQLIADGKVTRSWVGINMVPDDEAAEKQLFRDEATTGVIVKTIVPDAPAFRSDLRPRDIIVAVDGKPLRSTTDLQREVVRRKVGDTLRLKVLRDGEELEIPLTTAALPANPREFARLSRDDLSAPPPDPADGRADARDEEDSSVHAANFGLQMQSLDAGLAEHFGLSAASGALVSDVAADSPADVAGVKRGDLITEIDANPVRDADQAGHMLKDGDPEKGILLFLNRKGEKTYAVLKTAER